MHQPHFVYPFICWRTLGLLPLLPLWIMLLWTRVYTHLFGSLMSHLVGIYPEVRGCCCFFFFKDTCGAFTWYIQKAQKYIQWKFFLPLLSSVTQFQFINIFCRLCFWYLEKAMAPHSSTLAWKIPWTEEPGGLQSMGSLRVRHDWGTSLSLFTCMHWRRKWQPTPVFLPGESQGQGSLVAAVYGVTQSWTRLKWLSSSSSSSFWYWL